MFKIGVFIILTVLCHNASGRELDHRLNYGTVFEKSKKLYSTSEFWSHTFVIKLTDPNQFRAPPTCKCPPYTELFLQLANITKDTTEYVNNIQLQIKHMLSEQHKTVSSRSRRSLLPFIGSLSKTLFGTATSGDLELVAHHVNKLQRAHIKLSNEFHHEVQLLSSFMSTTDDRITNAVAGIHVNHEMIESLSTQMEHNTHNIKLQQAQLMSLVIQQLTHHQAFQHSYNNLFQGFITLLSGHLSPFVVPQSDLSTTIKHIQYTLQLHRPMYKLVHSHANQYYKHGDFMVEKHENNILVTVRFPLAPAEQPLQLYKVLSFPVPVNQSSTHGTSIQGLPSFLAVPSTQTSGNTYRYLSIYDTQVFDQCDQDAKHIYCHRNFAMQYQMDCAMALYVGNISTIQNLCKFQFSVNSISPIVHQLNQSHFLLANVSAASISCGDKTVEAISCHFCIIDVPCNCSIRSDKYSFMPRFTGCSTFDSQVTVSHPVNLALLHKFFGDKVLDSISVNNTFAEPLNITIKPFRLFDHKFSNVIANDRVDQLNLDKMVAAAKEDQIIYNTMADPILDSDIFVTSAIDYQTILSIVAVTLSTFAIFGVFVSYRKLKALTAALALSARIKPVSSLPQFIYTNAPTTPAPPSVVKQIHTALPQYNTYIFLTLCIITFCFILKQHLNKRRKPALQLEISNNETSITVKVMTLPTCISLCTFHQSAPITLNNITYGLRPQVTVNWHSFAIKAENNTAVLCPPSHINISWFTALQLRSLLRASWSPYITQLWITHNGYCIPVELEALSLTTSN